MVASVLVELSNKNIDKTFDYLVPPIWDKKIAVGKRVHVPFGKQELEGFVLELKDKSDVTDLKEILMVVDDEIILNEELLCLGKYMKEELLTTLISCFQVMLPKALKARKKVNLTVKNTIYYELTSSIESLNFESFTEKQQRILKLFFNNKFISKKDLNEISASSVKTLEKHGVLKQKVQEIYRYRLTEGECRKKYPLTLEQQNVINTVLTNKEEHNVYLLHGVTGSGKTEVYMEIIEQQLKNRKNSIVLVPEISLTPQIIERFTSRFEEDIAVLHSGLSDGEKYDEWRKIARGEVHIVIGARSAIFAPITNIGTIIIDEEHTTSYKQENSPKYSALDIAIWRGRYHHCPVIFGSATPTLESYARAKRKVYTLLELPHRVNMRQLPSIFVVDMNQEKRGQSLYFSSLLIEKMKERLAVGQQIILLLNRRGYSSVVTCSNCGYVEKCPNCDITLTFHKTSNTLRCHYCGYGTKKSDICPKCQEQAIKDLGSGTEKIEEELHRLFTTSRVVRMDVDTTSRKGAHEKIIRSFREKEYDILVGTQMIAKGLDFPNVTLVGVINADTSLNFPDFRSSEYTFQLLDQVSGRSGRGEIPGEVVIQTFNPDHYAIVCAREHNYSLFYNHEMQIRKQLKYPPYFYLAFLRVMGRDYDLLSTEVTKISAILKKSLTTCLVLGPSPCSVFRVNNIYRFGITIKYRNKQDIYPLLEKLQEHYKNKPSIKVDIDFNPLKF